MTKLTNPFISRFDLVVTRHKPLVEWLLREGYIDESTPVVEHAHADRVEAYVEMIDGSPLWAVFGRDRVIRPPVGVYESAAYEGFADGAEAAAFAAAHNAANVRGKHVLGVLPHHLSCEAATITEVQLAWTIEDREAMQRGDLSVEAVARAARGLWTYVVQRYEGPDERGLGRALGEAIRSATAYCGHFSLDHVMSDEHGKGGRSRPTLRCVEASQQMVSEVDIWTSVWRSAPNMAKLAEAPWLDEFGHAVDGD